MPPLKIGLALGAGAARGLAHIGVLQVLEENNIEVDVVAGTSAGAIIGSLYACGIDLKLLERMVESLNWNDLVRITFAKMGLISSERIYQMLRILTKDAHFEDLPVKTAVVATNINTREEVIIDKGLIADGVRASMSIPGIFIPMTIKEHTLVDGSLVNRVPVTVARELGANLIIAVDVGHPEFKRQASNIPDIILRTIDILERECAKHRINEADFTIYPQLKSVGSTQLNRASEIIAEGRREAQNNIEHILLKIQKLMY